MTVTQHTTQTFAELNEHNIVDFIKDIFDRRGSESYLGEEVSMSQHMLQGAYLAQKAQGDEPLIVAALLHDIGHYTSEFPEDALEKGQNNHHDIAGAKVLERFFPSVVTDCVRYHVDAKRYLCAVETEYFSALSSASINSLRLQGGPMNPEQVIQFKTLDHLEAIIQVRRWDDQGKDKNMSTPDFSYFEPMIRRVSASHVAASSKTL